MWTQQLEEQPICIGSCIMTATASLCQMLSTCGVLIVLMGYSTRPMQGCIVWAAELCRISVMVQMTLWSCRQPMQSLSATWQNGMGCQIAGGAPPVAGGYVHSAQAGSGSCPLTRLCSLHSCGLTPEPHACAMRMSQARYSLHSFIMRCCRECHLVLQCPTSVMQMLRSMLAS